MLPIIVEALTDNTVEVTVPRGQVVTSTEGFVVEAVRREGVVGGVFQIYGEFAGIVTVILRGKDEYTFKL